LLNKITYEAEAENTESNFWVSSGPKTVFKMKPAGRFACVPVIPCKVL